MKSHSTLAARVFGQPWMLYKPVAESMKTVVLRHARHESVSPDQVAAIVEARDQRRRTSGTLARRSMAARGMSVEPEDREMWYRAGNGVAVIPVEGLICKYASMINGVSQPQGVTPADLRYALGGALAEAGVRAVVLDIDSPGGTVAGGHDVCDAIAAAKGFRTAAGESVPIVAYAHDLCCSGAYLLASQCDAVFCSEQATVGSIGVCSCIVDESRMYEEAGVEVTLVASSPVKGGGVYDGAKVTKEHKAAELATVTTMADWFTQRVADGRGLSDEEAVAVSTGDVWVGERAVAMKLCDGVRGFDQLIAELSQ